MKFLAPALLAVMICLTLPAHAETLKQPGWKDSNGMRAVSGNTFTSGPKMISVEDHKKKNEAARKSWLSGEKPTVVKNKDGTTTLKQKLTNSKNGRKAQNVWSALND